MLVQFSVKNFRSFKEEVLLNMMPSKSLKDPKMQKHIIEDAMYKSVKALPLAAIYGANASGKSNLRKAMQWARQFIVEGIDQQSPVPTQPFRMDPKSQKAPSRFEFVFKKNGILYTYGFVVSQQEVQEEWLFAYYSSRETKLFERVTHNGKVQIDAGPKLIKETEGQQFLDFVAQGTRPNQLFLTDGYHRNITLFEPVQKWFEDDLMVLGSDYKNWRLPFSFPSDKQCSDLIAEDLQSFGIQVNPGKFDISQESSGTQKLIHLIQVFRDALTSEKTFFIDGLETSLHTHVCRRFVQLWLHGIQMKRARSQLIFTTHNTNLLGRNLMREDEIWFTEKDSSGSTQLTSLSEYKITDGLNIEKSYLNGRFGAIPYFGNIDDLLR